MTIQIILSLILIGILAGVLSGLVGVGGGIIMVPLLVMFFSFNQHQAQGTSLAVLAVPVTAVAVFNYYKEGQLNLKYAAIIAVFFVVGSIVGSKFALTLDQKILKKIFAVVLVLVAGKMLLEK
ncbi:sulfite exporter TauE/SafE family protein [Flavobacterium sp. F372]|uniref:Probable membrane transporter protein n=1 Tax=Flavobacterium bernardetii TaxID=2813823 RepID=A0ABR7J2A8_9FLAO|nr:sulfite exporter TauE/SafE family protein [Flavobacterium bernardetii]MBC5836158.1 sulfite exporter TauE/SafE family protein [Flavobacterium bernardetii]NHF71343.1 sulfite exporter TauE/SafE family protein [Flavobacterium bernardetii]